jgi:hypothetical protein
MVRHSARVKLKDRWHHAGFRLTVNREALLEIPKLCGPETSETEMSAVVRTPVRLDRIFEDADAHEGRRMAQADDASGEPPQFRLHIIWGRRGAVVVKSSETVGIGIL